MEAKTIVSSFILKSNSRVLCPVNVMQGRMGKWLSEMEEPPLALAQPKATAEDKAMRIERLKSGFRICKPQGSFMWPSNTLTLTPPSASSTSAPPGIRSLVAPSSAVPPQPKTPSSQTLNLVINLNEAPDEQNIAAVVSHTILMCSSFLNTSRD